jgi:hypothetical protein
MENIDNFALLLRYKLNLSVNIIKKFLTIWVKLRLTTNNVIPGYKNGQFSGNCKESSAGSIARGLESN